MNVSRLFIERPVATALVMLAILLFGIVGYRALPVAALPSVDYPTIQVNAAVPGASPETMAATVATPLERQFSNIAGIEAMSSSNSQGSTQVTITFSLDRQIDAAAQDVQAAIARAGGQLPPQMPRPPTFQKVNPGEQPVIYLALTSKTVPLYTVDEYAETLLAQRISMSKGVSQVNVFGAQKYAVRVQLNPDKLLAYGVGFDDVVKAVQNNNVNLPVGKLFGPKQSFTLQSAGQLTNAASYRPAIVAYKNGTPVRIEELGNVIDSSENERSVAWMNQDRAVILAIMRQPGTNTVEVVDGIKELIPLLRAEIPAALSLTTIYDRSESIRDSISDVKFTLVLTVGLVIVVISLFLRNLSATLIPGVAVPLSIVGTFAAMYLLGYSLNNLSLMALTLSVGFVVDDAIVMLENIVRYRELGYNRMDAAFAASKEIGFTIVSMTISLVAVFIPVLFMGGIIGRLLHEFAVTIAVAILISGFISLTFTPMLGSRFLSVDPHARHGFVFRGLEWAFNAWAKAYDVTLRAALKAHVLTALVAVASLVGTVYLFMTMPTGFIPSQDGGVIFGPTLAGQDISFESMAKHTRALADAALADPNTESIFTNAGDGNSGILFIRLKPRSQRALDVDRDIVQLRPKLARVPGISTFLQNPPPISVSGQNNNSAYQMVVQSTKLQDIYVWAPRLMDKMREVPGIVDITSDLQIRSPQVNVEIDRDRARALGVTPQIIQDTLYSAFGSRLASTFSTPTNQYSVIVEVAPEYQRTPDNLDKIYVHSANGPLVKLSSVAKLERIVGPLSVNHFGQLPAINVSFSLLPGYSLGDTAKTIEDTVRDLRVPETISMSFQGTVKEFQRSFAGLTVLLIVAVLVIYIVLGILYESFIHPITILSGLPSAAFGALATLVVFHKQLDLYAFVGLIMLLGVVKKNAIMMIDFAIEARHNGASARDAIYQGCTLRFRPIMMTTMAALFGTLPIALGYGEGGESRQPLGLCVVGGLVVSQLMTLYITPVVYLYLEAIQSKFRRKKKTPPTRTREESLASA